MMMIISGDSFVTICDQYCMFQRSLRPKCGRLANFYLIGVMEKIVMQILFPTHKGYPACPVSLPSAAKSSSLLDADAPAHIRGIY